MDLFEGLSITNVDLTIIVCAPFLGFFGGVIRALMLRNSLGTLPQANRAPKPFSWWLIYHRINWYFAWGVVGFGSGLLVALLFLGSFNEDTNLPFRVLAIALLAGYSAPNLWTQQQDLVALSVGSQLAKSGPDNGAGASQVVSKASRARD